MLFVLVSATAALVAFGLRIAKFELQISRFARSFYDEVNTKY